jgi:hypothetical protein
MEYATVAEPLVTAAVAGARPVTVNVTVPPVAGAELLVTVAVRVTDWLVGE